MTEGEGVDDVAVVGEREFQVWAMRDDGLSVDDAVRAGGRVASVSYRDVAGQVEEMIVFEPLPDESHRGAIVDSGAVGGGDAGALLSAVLEGVYAEERHAGDVFSAMINADDTAGFASGIVVVGGVTHRRGLAVRTDGTLPSLKPVAQQRSGAYPMPVAEEPTADGRAINTVQ